MTDITWLGVVHSLAPISLAIIPSLLIKIPLWSHEVEQDGSWVSGQAQQLWQGWGEQRQTHPSSWGMGLSDRLSGRAQKLGISMTVHRYSVFQSSTACQFHIVGYLPWIKLLMSKNFLYLAFQVSLCSQDCSSPFSLMQQLHLLPLGVLAQGITCWS